jgi:mRNA interferase MazF
VVIKQGDLFWVRLPSPRGSEPGYRHPHVIVQNDVFNQSRIGTVVVCTLSSNLALATSRANIMLAKGEGNLPKRSVVNVSQILTIDKSVLDEKIGTLSKQRVREIIEGISLVLTPMEIE